MTLSASTGTDYALRPLRWVTVTGSMVRVPASYKVFVHVIDRRPTLSSRKTTHTPTWTHQPPWQRLAVEHDHCSTGTGTGQYQIFVGLYDSATGERLPAISADGQRPTIQSSSPHSSTDLR
jgi:hypothetical protein